MRIIKPPKKGKSYKSQDASNEYSGRFDVVDSQELDLEGARSQSRKNYVRNKQANTSEKQGFAKSGKLSKRIDGDRNHGSGDGDFELTLDGSKKEYNRLLNSGVRLLAMREHSIKEIHDKLNSKTEAPDLVNAVLDELIANNYVSDERFTESYIRVRSNKGFGPIKIRAELKSKGVSDSLIAEYLDIGSPVWIDQATTQYQKKYGAEGVSDYNAWTKRARFMQSRGFTMEHIQVALPEIEFD